MDGGEVNYRQAVAVMPSIAEQFQVESVANCTTEKYDNERIKLCVFGLAGELGEVVEPLKKFIFRGTPFSRTDMALELGDVLYYFAVLADEMGFTLEEIMLMNMQKLRNRRAGIR